MKNTKIHLLFLSDPINLKRDKSILYYRVNITIFVISVFLLAIYHIGFTSDFLIRGEGQFTNECHLSSTLIPFSESWCKEKKIEILKKGFPAVFQDMSKMKDYKYFATTKSSNKVLSFYSFNNIPGIYMITNLITKKIYIGMSTNLKGRFYNYLDKNRLNRDRSSRINKALLKYGFDKFSISILELPQSSKVSSSYLREREDFYIRVFKPQYNIKRSTYNKDTQIGYNKTKIKFDIPTKIKNVLDKCLDINELNWNLASFKLNSIKGVYSFVAITPKGAIRASSEGWFQGNVYKDIGFEKIKITNPNTKGLIWAYGFIEIEKLAHFYHKEGHNFVKKRLSLKIKALKLKDKKENK